MKLKAIKTEAEVLAALGGDPGTRPIVEITSLGGAIKGVRVGRCHFSLDTYSFTIAAEVDAEPETRYRVTAKVAGFPDAITYHAEWSDANDKCATYSADAIVSSPESIKVMVNGAGEVVGEVGEAKATGFAPPPAPSSDIPF